MSNKFSHLFNCFKFRAMHYCFSKRAVTILPNATWVTCKELSEAFGMTDWNVSRNMNHYTAKYSSYFIRKKCKSSKKCKSTVGRPAFKYKLNKQGLGYLLKYAARYDLGLDLNLCVDHIPQPMACFDGIREVNVNNVVNNPLDVEKLITYCKLNKLGWKNDIQLKDKFYF